MAGRPFSRKVRFPRTSGGPIERRPEPGQRSSSWKGAFAIASLSPRARRPSFRPGGRGSWNREYFTRSRRPALSDSAWTSIAEPKTAPACPGFGEGILEASRRGDPMPRWGECRQNNAMAGAYAEGMARPTGFEPVTFGFGGQHSIRLSYGREGGKDTPRRRPRPLNPAGGSLVWNTQGSWSWTAGPGQAPSSAAQSNPLRKGPAPGRLRRRTLEVRRSVATAQPVPTRRRYPHGSADAAAEGISGGGGSAPARRP